MYRIAISGSYGGMNLGDEAILEAILKEIGLRSNVEVVIFSFNPDDTKKRHHVRAIPFRQMHKEQIQQELKKIDLFIFGGGGILFEGLAQDLLRDLIWAQELNIPTMVYAVSVGPITSQDTKQLVADALNKVDIVTVRDSESKKILNDLGVTKQIDVTQDPALLLKPDRFTNAMLEKEGVKLDKPIIGFSVREPGSAAPDLDIAHYHSVLANSADFMIERFNAQILFIPMELGINRDLQHAHAIISKMMHAQKTSVLKGEYSSSQLLGLCKHLSFAVGMRLHFLIFAGLQCVPFIPLSYASKVEGFLQDLEMSAIPLIEWNTGKICAMIDRAWDTKKDIQKRLKEKIPIVKKKAQMTPVIFSQFLRTITPKKK